MLLTKTVHAVLQPVAPEEQVVLVPDPDEQREAAGKRREAPHRPHQARRSSGDVERDDQQRQREGERRVAERLEPGDFVSAGAREASAEDYSKEPERL